MLSAYNILSPAYGKAISSPTRDIVLGSYYLTQEKQGARGEGKIFSTPNEAILAYESGAVALHAKVKVRLTRDSELIETTVGRVIFNEAIPEELRFINDVADRKVLSQVVSEAYNRLGSTKTVQLLDALKDLGFKYATRSGMGIAVDDIAIPEQKDKILVGAEKSIDGIEQQFRRGLIIREEDCKTTEGVTMVAIKEGNDVVVPLKDRIIGRVAVEDVVASRGRKVIIEADQDVTEEAAEQIEQAGVETVVVRSVLTCKSRYGVSAKCYGRNLASGKQVEIGEAVGIIAAQSIGEPGTQLTMRTFHTGGVAGFDITQGLPRVEELFEARKPKGQAIIAEVSGEVKVAEAKGSRKLIVVAKDRQEYSAAVPFGVRWRMNDGDKVTAGDQLTEGSVNPHCTRRIRGS